MTALPPAQLLIGQMLRAPAGRNPEQTLHDGAGQVQTYRQFHTRIGQLAASLNRLGLGRGATIAVMDWDMSRYPEGFFGISMIGATLHTVNIRLSPEQVPFTKNMPKMMLSCAIRIFCRCCYRYCCCRGSSARRD